jgi:ATP-dependent 26S proteasome regulatory subunit
LPDEHSRLAILSVKLREAPVASNVDLSVLAALCDGMSGADVSELCRCACQLALRCASASTPWRLSSDLLIMINVTLDFVSRPAR